MKEEKTGTSVSEDESITGKNVKRTYSIIKSMYRSSSVSDPNSLDAEPDPGF
jgi:hypothetical protein